MKNLFVEITEKLKELWDNNPIFNIVVISLAGSISRILISSNKYTFGQKIVVCIVGCIVAYLSGLMTHVIGVDNSGTVSLFGFMSGMFGFSFLKFSIDKELFLFSKIVNAIAFIIDEAAKKVISFIPSKPTKDETKQGNEPKQ